MVNANDLGEAMGWSLSLSDYERLAPGFNNAMIAAGCNTVNRAAMWCAQIGHESVGLKYMEEIASGDAYEARGDLGNTQPGDGRRFKGSGPIQLTGRANFRSFTKWARENGHSDIDFEANPELVRSDPKWGFLAATFYWVTHPIINTCADNGWIWDATRAINGGTNGINDRISRWNKCLNMGSKLLPDKDVKAAEIMEVQLEYNRAHVRQDTYYWCGPASTQTAIQSKTGNVIGESVLARELGTTVNGTDWIGQFPRVLNKYLPGAEYRHFEMPNDPPNQAQKDALWDRLVNSINGGYAVIANVVAPPSNYPRAVAPSTISPAYGGGTVYHYFAVAGYKVDGIKKVWIADSGFAPYGYWMSFNQLCSLIPPKGYAAATVKSESKEHGMALLTGESAAALNDTKLAAQRAERIGELILDQLVGFKRDEKGWKYSGWPVLGNKTIVDALGVLIKDVEELKAAKKGGK